MRMTTLVLMARGYVLLRLASGSRTRHNALCASEHKCQCDQNAHRSNACAHFASS
jgi:hypothetical protein